MEPKACQQSSSILALTWGGLGEAGEAAGGATGGGATGGGVSGGARGGAVSSRRDAPAKQVDFLGTYSMQQWARQRA
jgi:hypothetical protein